MTPPQPVTFIPIEFRIMAVARQSFAPYIAVFYHFGLGATLIGLN